VKKILTWVYWSLLFHCMKEVEKPYKEEKNMGK
jgi:hypothetical protein